jgi:succinate dehydrogenase / fumarate reductase, membrane anchor subunit
MAATRAKATRASVYAKPAAGATGFETFSWYFFRITGLLLIFLAIIHLVIMHVSNDVSATSYQFVASRYANPFWRVYDLLLLTLALLHGMNGVRVIVDDYVRARGWRLAWLSFLGAVSATFWLMGTLTIVSFHPGSAPLGTFFHTLLHLK